MSLPRALLPLPLALACTPAPFGGSDGSDDSAAPDVPAPATTLPATTTTTGTTTEDPDPPKFDLPPPEPRLSGCSLDAPPGTMLGGNSPLGPFVAKRAYFDHFGFEQVVLLFVSPGADPAVEIEHHDGRTEPVFFGQLATGYIDDGWLGTWTLAGGVYADSMAGYSQYPYTVTLTELAGNWYTYDAADPPRLVGTLVGDISGPFDAVFCDDIVLSYPAP